MKGNKSPEYRRDREHNYMVLAAPEEVRGDEYEVRMIFTNQIPGLLKCKQHILDGKTEFYYEITSKQPMSRVFSTEKIRSEDIQIIFSGIEKAMQKAAEFLLDDNNFVLTPDYTYMDMETKEVFLCYLPLYKQDITVSFRELSEYILQHLDHEDEQAVLWGYEVYSRTVTENYRVKEVLQGVYRRGSKEKIAKRQEFREEVILPLSERSAEADAKPKFSRSILKKGKKKPQVQTLLIILAIVLVSGGLAVLSLLGMLSLTQAGGVMFLIIGVGIYLAPGKRKGKLRRTKQEDRTNYKEDELLKEHGIDIVDETMATMQEQDQEEYGMTTVLNVVIHGVVPILISIHPELRENIILTKEEMLVGKLKGQVDIFLNLPTISRLHAKIERTETESFLVDLNSTNGTFLNGERLMANEAKVLQTGDEIFFAGAGYYFKG